MEGLTGFLFVEWLDKPLWLWLGFLAIVLGLLAFDLGVLHRDDREMGVAESLKLSVFYIAVAVVFGLTIWWGMGGQAGIEYFTGYLIEKSLSIDNVFVISMIFGYFAIPTRYQYRALVWGIVAVIVLRGLMIAAGAALVQSFDWVLYVFGGILILTGLKMMFAGDPDPDLSKNPVVRFTKRFLRVTPELHGERFFVKVMEPKSQRMVRMATPLFLALVVINVADIVFAIDSVPAIFAVTQDTYIVYTANIMAILGLRALYFALAAMVNRFHYLKYALALVLIFIGTKIFAADMLGLAKIPPLLSLVVTLSLIIGGVVWSLWKTRGEKPQAAEA